MADAAKALFNKPPPAEPHKGERTGGTRDGQPVSRCRWRGCRQLCGRAGGMHKAAQCCRLLAILQGCWVCLPPPPLPAALSVKLALSQGLLWRWQHHPPAPCCCLLADKLAAKKAHEKEVHELLKQQQVG